MAGTRWTSKRRALVIATFTLAFAAFLRLAAPERVSIAEDSERFAKELEGKTALGSTWQCSQTVFLVTTCTQVRQF